jgi:hypothetical protein
MSFKQIAHYLIRVSVILICFGILYKVYGILTTEGGYGAHYAGPLKVAPDAFIRFASLLLLLAISLLLLALVEIKTASGAAENRPHIGESAPRTTIQAPASDSGDSAGDEG